MPDLHNHLPLDRRLAMSAATVLVLLSACAGAASTSSSVASSTAPGTSGPPPSAVPSVAVGPTVGPIDHSTAAADVVLRLEQGGGFVPMDFLASQAPSFTLYGNGIVVFQPKVETFPQPDAGGVVHNVPWRTAKLDEGQIQQLLEFALGPGGLGTARDAYLAGGIADAPNTIFTVHAGGLDKTVVVSALAEQAEGPDAAARAALFRLASRLQDFDQGGSVSTDTYESDRYRGVLNERDATQPGPVIAWPWPAIKPADFVAGQGGDAGGLGFPHRTLSTADVAALGIKDAVGGLQGVALKGSSGKTYTLIVRPLLPDEQE